MKIKISILLCLVFFSLACLSTSAAVPTVTATAGTVATMAPMGEVVIVAADMVPAGTVAAADRCALVVADSALHLREGATVHAASVDYLLAGELVVILDDTNAEWWQVQRGDAVGFARSIYLRESECVK